MGGSFSSNSGSSSGSGKKGGEWKNKVYFDPESDSSTGSDYNITDSELRQKFRELVDTDERIVEMEIFSHKLLPFQVVQGGMHHAFICFETNDWYWSMEKNTEGITIQRSKKKMYVKCKYRRGNRNTPIALRRNGDSRAKVVDVIDFLYTNNELNRKYNVATDNCQIFANKLFNKFAINIHEHIVFF